QSIPAERPEVGSGATYAIGSDRYAATVIKVSPSGHQVTVQDDEDRLTSGSPFSEAQTYEYLRNASGRVMTFTWSRKYGRYVNGGSYRLTLGVRRAYRDPSF